MRFQDSEDEQFQTVVALPPAKRVKLQQSEIKEEVAEEENEDTESESEAETDSEDYSDSESETF